MQTEDKFSFSPNDPRASVKLDVDFRSIKGKFVGSFDNSYVSTYIKE